MTSAASSTPGRPTISASPPLRTIMQIVKLQYLSLSGMPAEAKVTLDSDSYIDWPEANMALLVNVSVVSEWVQTGTRGVIVTLKKSGGGNVPEVFVRLLIDRLRAGFQAAEFGYRIDEKQQCLITGTVPTSQSYTG